jgi:hypothetical protein
MQVATSRGQSSSDSIDEDHCAENMIIGKDNDGETNTDVSPANTSCDNDDDDDDLNDYSYVSFSPTSIMMLESK